MRLADTFQSTSQNRNYVTALIVLNGLIFFPLMGRGFIHDDFVHFRSAAFDSVWQGLTHATGGMFYAPLAWLSFKIDWLIWGQNPFLSATINLLLHITNILLVYYLVRFLCRSNKAAFWAALGFALCFPANAWAVMWIATRAHLLATAFYLGAVLATLWFARTNSSRIFPAAIIVVLSTLSTFSKEIGITVPAAIVLTLLYERIGKKNLRVSYRSIILMMLVLTTVAGIYMVIRAQSGAVGLTVGANTWYSFSPTLEVIAGNLRAYTWRTFGLLSIAGSGAVLTLLLQGRRPRLSSIDKSDILLSVALVMVSIAPIILLAGRSGIYSYLPSTFAAISLGTLVRIFDESVVRKPKHSFLSLIPAVFVVAVLAGFTVGQSMKWKTMAETSTIVLKSIHEQYPEIDQGAYLVLNYQENDSTNLFPDCFASWGFPLALQLLYSDPDADGSIVRDSEPYSLGNKTHDVRFDYSRMGRTPVTRIVK